MCIWQEEKKVIFFLCALTLNRVKLNAISYCRWHLWQISTHKNFKMLFFCKLFIYMYIFYFLNALYLTRGRCKTLYRLPEEQLLFGHALKWRRTVRKVCVEGQIRNISLKSMQLFIRCCFKLWWSYFAVERNRSNNFGRGSHKKHFFCEIIIKSKQLFTRSCC